jgi:hypothetical protein
LLHRIYAEEGNQSPRNYGALKCNSEKNMSTSIPPKPRRRRWSVALILLVLLVLLSVAGGIWLFTGRSAQARDMGPGVSISAPVTGALLDLGTPLSVSATGYDPKGITRLELYVNGVLTAVQANTPDSISSSLEGFTASWTPTAVGRYILTARGYRSDSQFADSSIVILDVVAPANQVTGSLGELLPVPPDMPCPNLNQLASMLGVSIEDLLTLNPGLRGTDADLPLECGVHITLPRSTTPPPGLDRGSPGGSGSTPGGTGEPGTTPGSASTLLGGTGEIGAPPIPLPGTPSIPTWVSVDPSACTSIILTWTGSPNAEGYTLYRNAPGDSHLNAIAHLPVSRTTYTDTITLAGGYIYQVAAVRAGLEALSATYSFTTLDYPACEASLRSTEPPAGTSLYLIIPSLQTDTAYEGVYCYVSMNGGAQGRLPEADFSSLAPLGDGLTYDLRTPPARGHTLLTRTGSDPITVEMRCMGRRGVYSDSLGGFLASHPSTEWDGHELNSNGAGGTGAFTIHYCITPDPGLVNCIGPSAGAPPSLFPVIPSLAPLLAPMMIAADLPAPTNLRFESLLPEGIIGRRLVWSWTAAGPYTERTLTGYQVSVTGMGRSWIEDDVTGNGNRKFLFNGTWLPCGTTFTFQVTAVQGILRSPPSAPLPVSSAACPDPTRARVLVIFNSLTLSSGISTDPLSTGFDAGDLCIICRDNEFELSIWFGANTAGHYNTLYWKPNGTGEDFVRLTDPGEYDLSSQLLSSDRVSPGRSNNNIMAVDVIGGSSRIYITGMAVEHDALGFTSQDCYFSYSSPEYSPQVWQHINESHTMGGGTNPFTQAQLVHDDQNRNLDLFGTDTIMCTMSIRLIGEPLP